MKKIFSLKFVICFLLIMVSALSIGYSAFTAIFSVDGSKAIVRVEADIRVTGISLESLNNAESTYEDYDVDKIKFDINLPNASSTVTYRVSVTNIEALEMAIVAITGLPDNLDYEISNYELFDKICDASNECSLGITKDDILITIKYAEDGFNSSDTTYSVDLVVDFEEYFESVIDPQIDDAGLIPVVIADNGVVTTISEKDRDWFDYENKKWANAILVKETGTKTRDFYQNNYDEVVNQADILAYYVWIPRFSYKLYNTITVNYTSPKIIDIQFEDINTISRGSGIDQYLTHPAFWWDVNSNKTRESGEEIAGFWVGKFEPSKGTSSNVTTSNPVILPNAATWVSQTVVLQFQNMIKFSGGTFNTTSGAVTFAGSTLYGLSSTTDSHMMKNNEWGAVAYLSHSSYGIGKEIRINNYYASSSCKTGCGAASDSAGQSTTCSIVYGAATEYPQSSTGNITGVFDMSGGAWDRLMGNFSNNKGSSGFSAFPVSKYYDLFTITALSACTYPICGGHGLTETYEWYGDLMNYPNKNYPWFVRGGGYEDTTQTGAFNLGRNVGQSSAKSTSRSVLIV